jgi:hypothetical protein
MDLILQNNIGTVIWGENVRAGTSDKKVKDIMKSAYNILVGRVTWSRQNIHTGHGQQVAITKDGVRGKIERIPISEEHSGNERKGNDDMTTTVTVMTLDRITGNQVMNHDHETMMVKLGKGK